MDNGVRKDTVTYIVIDEQQIDETVTILTEETEWISEEYNVTE